jgi:acetate kinase
MSAMILTCNAGSNSLKCALYAADGETLRYRHEADSIHGKPCYAIQSANGDTINQFTSNASGYAAALQYFLKWLQDSDPTATLKAIGHRVVHGGKEYAAPVVVDDNVFEMLEALVPLAPLHQPHNLALIKAMRELYPDIPQIACFDTAFHRTQDWLAQAFALPRNLTQEDAIVRYGFHGLSYEYIAGCLPDYAGDNANGRVIVAHLGNGASMCAMKDRKSIASTMGFTALDGLMMGTRCGDLDPGAILYLMQQKDMTSKQIETLLYKESGLLGVSGISHDMRDLQASEKTAAKEAIELFCYSAAKQLGGLITLLGGLDALVFTGGMGSHNAAIRQSICNYIRWLGAEVSESANQMHQPCISTEESSIAIFALPTDEEAVIARHTARMMRS